MNEDAGKGRIEIIIPSISIPAEVEVNVVAELPCLKLILEDKRFWHVIVNYTMFEMLGKELIKKHFENKGLTGMDDWVGKLSCKGLVSRLFKLELINEETYQQLKHLVEVRNDFVHDIRAILVTKAFNEKEMADLIDSSSKALSAVGERSLKLPSHFDWSNAS
jgi:hypothetical protein